MTWREIHVGVELHNNSKTWQDSPLGATVHRGPGTSKSKSSSGVVGTWLCTSKYAQCHICYPLSARIYTLRVLDSYVGETRLVRLIPIVPQLLHVDVDYQIRAREGCTHTCDPPGGPMVLYGAGWCSLTRRLSLAWRTCWQRLTWA